MPHPKKPSKKSAIKPKKSVSKATKKLQAPRKSKPKKTVITSRGTTEGFETGNPTLYAVMVRPGLVYIHWKYLESDPVVIGEEKLSKFTLCAYQRDEAMKTFRLYSSHEINSDTSRYIPISDTNTDWVFRIEAIDEKGSPLVMASSNFVRTRSATIAWNLKNINRDKGQALLQEGYDRPFQEACSSVYASLNSTASKDNCAQSDSKLPPDAKGYIMLVLHAHMPFIRHPEYDKFLEEHWFYEAAAETYVPLIMMLRRSTGLSIKPRLTLSLSPTLIEMCNDELLRQRFMQYLQSRIELSEKELNRYEVCAPQHRLANMYYQHYTQVLRNYDQAIDRDIIRAFKQLQDQGLIEILACPATHAFLPNMHFDRASVLAQLQVGIQVYAENFQVRPKGVWLPECAYFPGLDEYLKSCSIRYAFVDTHGLLQSQPTPTCGVYAPISTKQSFVLFGRDPRSSKQVWSSQFGYPANELYREFYSDIGYHRPEAYVGEYWYDQNCHETGLKYMRITGNGKEKDFYNPDSAANLAQTHARDFLHRCVEHAGQLRPYLDRPPLLNCMYDAELFGHWWFEGLKWLEALFLEIESGHFSGLQMITGYDYLLRYPHNFIAEPGLSSWGQGGYSQYWLNEENDWIYHYLHAMSAVYQQILRDANTSNLLESRALSQMFRELLLAQSSDWAFILSSKTHSSYARQRLDSHIKAFYALGQMVQKKSIDIDYLTGLESTHNIFKSITYKVFQS